MSYQEKYKQRKFLGRGQYGKVYLVEDKYNQLLVAKKIDWNGINEIQKQLAMKQIQIHRKLHHKNIIEFIEYFKEEDNLILILEYCQFGDLSLYINKFQEQGQFFQEKLIINWFMQLLVGVNYLHQNKVIHRDLKTSNIFINPDGLLKLGDFGISKILNNTKDIALTTVGTPYYMSPQVCQNDGYTFKSDIWGLGCILYQLCCLERPFEASNLLGLANKIANDQVKDIPPHYSKQLNKLVKSLLEKDPIKRPSIRQIFQNNFIAHYYEHFRYSERQTKTTNQQNKKYQIVQTMGQLNTQELEGQNEIITKQISKSNDKIINLKSRCQDRMGRKLFQSIYSQMKIMKRQGYTDAQIERELNKRYNKNQLTYSLDVAQLIYMEDSS